MGSAPSRFRNDYQEQLMRTVANENDNGTGSTNDPKPLLTGSIRTGIILKGDGVSTKENRVDIPGPPAVKFSDSTEIQVSTEQQGTAQCDLFSLVKLMDNISVRMV